jgi:hypothetical protein
MARVDMAFVSKKVDVFDILYHGIGHILEYVI